MIQFLKPLHLACADDEARPNLSLIEIKNNIATATNGMILVKIDLSLSSQLTPDDLKTLNGKYIHKEVWKEIYKCDSLEFDDVNIFCFKNGIKKTFDYSDANGTFFETNQIVIDIKESGEESKRLVGYSPSFITTIHKIFQNDALFFSFSKGDKGTIVFTPEEGMFAVLMPRSGEGINRYFFI